MSDQDRLAALLDAAQAVLAASRKYTFGPTMEDALARLDAASDAAGVRVAPSPETPGLREAAQQLDDRGYLALIADATEEGEDLVAALRAALAAAREADRG